ncbi:DUF3967 domain-containing protein [Bacillus pumilus]|uniref:DUF3967 domain-containing protein n=1 Tax=Bacillus pumilus TaxID=1408 RepID=UPI002493B694|nr:DUF3967 domain-containing protein [Bacillus pumilus]
MKKQQEYIQRSLLERDKKLLEAIRESQETKKLIAATEQKEKEGQKNVGGSFGNSVLMLGRRSNQD